MSAIVPDEPAPANAIESSDLTPTDPTANTQANGVPRVVLERSAPSEASIPPEGSILTGKQEHCLWSSTHSMTKTDTILRSEKRTHCSRSPCRDRRPQHTQCLTTFRRSFPIVIWRSCPHRFGITHLAIYLCESRTKLSIP